MKGRRVLAAADLFRGPRQSAAYRDISGFPGYRVGDDGTVWSAWRRTSDGKGSRCFTGAQWHQLATRRHSQGYRMVQLKDSGGVFRVRYVHRLVLEAFVGPCPEGMIGCHANDVQNDNRLENLSWGTNSSNLLDRNRNKPEATPRGEGHWNRRLTEDEVRAIKARLASGENPYHVAPDFGVKPATVYDIAKGKTWKYVA